METALEHALSDSHLTPHIWPLLHVLCSYYESGIYESKACTDAVNHGVSGMACSSGGPCRGHGAMSGAELMCHGLWMALGRAREREAEVALVLPLTILVFT